MQIWQEKWGGGILLSTSEADQLMTELVAIKPPTESIHVDTILNGVGDWYLPSKHFEYVNAHQEFNAALRNQKAVENLLRQELASLQKEPGLSVQYYRMLTFYEFSRDNPDYNNAYGIEMNASAKVDNIQFEWEEVFQQFRP
jgi:hypothetical protein